MNPFRASHKTQEISPQNPYLMKQTDWVCLQNTCDYSPFGVSLDGRTMEGDFYRRGFNGMEKDDEFKGKGNSYTTEFRQLDPRMGRWLSPDPVFQPWQTPYCSMDNNPIRLIDRLGNVAGGGNPEVYNNEKSSTVASIDDGLKRTKAGKIFDAEKLFANYQKGVAKEEAAAATGTNKERWKGLIGENACALNMSRCLNMSGYIIREHTTSAGRVTWTGGKNRANNNNKPYQYILSADEMGSYLKQKLGSPTFHLQEANSDTQVEDFVAKVEKYNNFRAIIYLDAHNQSAYGATGHVDLLYEDWGGDPAILGSSEELDDYLDWNNGDGWFNKDSKLEVYIWILDYESKD